MKKYRLSSPLVIWLLPICLLFLVLWFEAEVPGLPDLTQGNPITQTLRDSSQGQGLNGLFSHRAFLDVSYRLVTVLIAFATAFFLTRYSPGWWIRFFNNIIYYVQNISRKRFGVFLFLLAFILSLSFFYFVRGLTPRVGDEIAYLFQARLFSQGQLTMPAPMFSEFFDVLLVVDGMKWYSQYPPGHSFLLAPAMLLGLPWVVGPLMGGIAVVSIWRLGARLYDENTGRLAGLLTLVAPFFIYMSGSYLSHSTCLAMGCLAALGIVIAVQETGRISILAALLGGSALGFSALIRPLTAIGLALGVSVLALINGSSLIKLRLRRLLIVMPLFVLCAATISSIAPLYNWATTGHPLRWGYELAQPTSHDLGFGKRGHLDIDYTPSWALFNTRVRWRWMDGGFLSGRDPIPGGGFFFWPFPAIAVIMAILTRGMPRRNDIALAFVIFGLAAAYFFYYFLEMCWGPRFLYESAFALILLTARGAITMGEAASCCGWTNKRGETANNSSVFTGAFLLPAVFVALIHITLPTGATGERLYDPSTSPTKNMDYALTRALKKANVKEGLVFYKESEKYGFYENAWRHMFVDQQRNIVFAKDMGIDNQKIIEDFGGQYWVATFNGDYVNPVYRIDHFSKNTSAIENSVKN